jgi:hypothetical protein
MISKQYFSLAGFLLASLISIQAAQAALIVPVSGRISAIARGFVVTTNEILNDSPPDVVLGDTYGSFSTRAAVGDVNFPAGSIAIDGAVNPDSLRIEADLLSIPGSSGADATGDASGGASFVFDVLQPTRFFATLAGDNVSIGTGVVLAQGGQDIFTGGISLGGQQVHLLNLDPGRYELSLSFLTLPNAGGPRFGTTSFALTPVPLPAGLWLLGSALLGLVSAARTRRALN